MRDKPSYCFDVHCPQASKGRGFVLGAGDPNAPIAIQFERPAEDELAFSLKGPLPPQLSPQVQKELLQWREMELQRRKAAFPELEDRFLTKGAPVRGMSGAELSTWVFPAVGGLKMEDCYLENTLHCFPGDTPVEAYGIERVYRRFYEGRMFSITTAANEVLSGTPNHPILTKRGWIRAGQLKEGDYLVRSALGEGASRSNPNVYYSPIPFEQLFDSLSVSWICERAVSRNMDFHGDGGYSEVDVVTSNGLLRVGIDPFLSQHFLKKPLKSSDESSGFLEAFGATDGGQLFMLNGIPLTPASFVRRDRLPLSFDLRHLPPNHFPGGAAVSNFDPAGLEQLFQKVRVEVKANANRFHPFTSEVSLSRIVKIESRDFSGHVYNLQTTDGYYTANGFIVHNCAAGSSDEPYPQGAERDAAEACCAYWNRLHSQRSPAEFGVLITSYVESRVAIVFLHPAGLLKDTGGGIVALPLQIDSFKKAKEFVAQGKKVIVLAGGKAAKWFLGYAEAVTRWCGHYVTETSETWDARQNRISTGLTLISSDGTLRKKKGKKPSPSSSSEEPSLTPSKSTQPKKKRRSHKQETQIEGYEHIGG